MEFELAGPDPTPLESLLVQRVLICWLRLHLAEFNAGTCGTDSTTEAFQRQLERANRLYLSSVKMLATVRRMALPLRVDLNLTARAARAEPRMCGLNSHDVGPSKLVVDRPTINAGPGIPSALTDHAPVAGAAKPRQRPRQQRR
jgi:hypothetical protein